MIYVIITAIWVGVALVLWAAYIGDVPDQQQHTEFSMVLIAFWPAVLVVILSVLVLVCDAMTLFCLIGVSAYLASFPFQKNLT